MRPVWPTRDTYLHCAENGRQILLGRHHGTAAARLPLWRSAYAVRHSENRLGAPTDYTSDARSIALVWGGLAAQLRPSMPVKS